MNKKLTLITLSLVAALGSSFVVACDFDCTLNKHLDAIQKRDFAQFESTLTTGDRLTFILPNGSYTENTQAYKTMLKAWFAETGWTMSPKVIAVEKTTEMGSALLLVNYDEADRGGKPYHLEHYLSLIFKNENGKWGLVHDQNTIAKAKE